MVLDYRAPCDLSKSRIGGHYPCKIVFGNRDNRTRQLKRTILPGGQVQFRYMDVHIENFQLI